MKKKIKKCQKSSLNEKLSDIVGSSNLKLNDNFELNYEFFFRSKL